MILKCIVIIRIERVHKKGVKMEEDRTDEIINEILENWCEDEEEDEYEFN